MSNDDIDCKPESRTPYINGFSDVWTPNVAPNQNVKTQQWNAIKETIIAVLCEILQPQRILYVQYDTLADDTTSDGVQEPASEDIGSLLSSGIRYSDRCRSTFNCCANRKIL